MKCGVCDHEFTPKKENKYTVVQKVLFRVDALYDAFDCPECGCQILASERFERVPTKVSTDHWIDNADSYICPKCRLEVNNPMHFDCKCPRCGFMDVKD